VGKKTAKQQKGGARNMRHVRGVHQQKKPETTAVFLLTTTFQGMRETQETA